jgi:hypothetical protein
MNVVGKMKALMNESMVSTSVAGGVLFFIVANPEVFKAVDKVLGPILHQAGSAGKWLGAGQGLTGVHSVVFGLMFYLILKYLWTRILTSLSIVEGMAGGRGGKKY